MLTEGSRSKCSLPFFLGTTVVMKAAFSWFFGFQLEAKCVSKNDDFPYWFCVVGSLCLAGLCP